MDVKQIALFNEGNDTNFKIDFNSLTNIIQPNILEQRLYVGFDSEKSPIDLKTGHYAKSNDSTTWVDFKTAITSAPNFKNVLGLGIMLGDTNFGNLAGFDIDNCVDENGNICTEAKEIIDKFDSYTEFSPSGTGIHILFFAVKKTNTCKLSVFDWCERIELYDHLHYFTLTGNVINNKPIEHRQSACDWLVEKYYKPFEQADNEFYSDGTYSYVPQNKPQYNGDKTDEEFFEIGLKQDDKFRELYNGERPNGDESRDDLALIGKLMYWCNNNIPLVVREFLNSPYVALKDEKHKKKLQRKDYIDRTIKKVKNSSTARQDNELYRVTNKAEKSSSNKAKEPTSLDKIKSLTKGISNVKDAKKYDWIVKDIFARQLISIIFGEPGCGKTWLLLYISLILTNGGKLWQDLEVKKAKVLFFEGDAPVVTLNERISTLKKTLNDDYFKYVSRYEADAIDVNLSLFTEDGRNNFESFVMNFMPDLIVIDTLISFIDDEKDPEKTKKVVDFLRLIAVKYNCHVAIVHHARKRDRDEIRKKLDQSDVIGSSVITRLASIVIGVDKYVEK